MINATYIDHMGSDLSVVNAARVSFGKKSELECIDLVKGKYMLSHKDRKLINYLAEHNHISPFGHCFASFHIKAPVFVARQLVKHKFLRWNEISRRYVDDEPEFYEPDKWRGKAANKKQGSAGSIDLDEIDSFHCNDSIMTNGNDGVYLATQDTLSMYKALLRAGVCPEQARMILPQSMMTEWYWSGSLDAFADMCKLRCAPDTQYETQLVAWDIYYHMKEFFPVSWEALTKSIDDA